MVYRSVILFTLLLIFGCTYNPYKINKEEGAVLQNNRIEHEDNSRISAFVRAIDEHSYEGIPDTYYEFVVSPGKKKLVLEGWFWRDGSSLTKFIGRAEMYVTFKKGKKYQIGGYLFEKRTRGMLWVKDLETNRVIVESEADIELNSIIIIPIS